MEFVFFAAFSALAAIMFNAFQPWVFNQSWAANRVSTYGGKTFFTAVAFFFVLLAAGFILGLVGESESATPPTA